MILPVLLGILFLSLNAIGQHPDAELMEHTTTIQVDHKKLTKEVIFRLKINNRAGEKHTKVTLPFSELDKLKKISAHIEDAQGQIVKKLRGRDIIERSAISEISFYEDDFVKEFTLKHNSYPYTIVCSYKREQSEYLFIEAWVPVRDVRVPTHNATLSITLPHDFPFSYTGSQVGEPVESLNQLGQTYRWKTSYTDILKGEPLAPSLVQLLPHLLIVPQQFTFDKEGSLESWGHYGNWQNTLLVGQNTLPEWEKDKIRSLLQGIDSNREKIRVLYHYLQDETRYINITIETGGLKPYPADYVARNKYGDCKALTNYFKSVLDFVGIKAYYTKVYVGTPIKHIDTDFPSQQFNHVILYIPQEDEDIWLDCTSDAAFGYLGTFTQNRRAFVVESDSSHFIRTPSLKPADVLERRKIVMAYSDPLAIVKYQNRYRGEMYETFLSLAKDYSASEKSRIVTNYLIGSGEDLQSFAIRQQHRDSTAIEFVYTVTSPNIYKHYGNDLILHNVPFDLWTLEKPADRQLSLQLDAPVCKTDTLLYNMPSGYSMTDSLHYHLKEPYGEYSYEAFAQNGTITVVKKLLIHAAEYPLSDYANFYQFYKKVIDHENTPHLLLSK